ncbi:MAG: hypothetical protein LBU51_05010 [Bacteroidales bacterium]|jgi:hypothetical protein|nr:hypothetical protein [Bacteroidales bacterium]
MRKKFMVTTLAVGLLGSMSMVGQCLHPDAQKSVYLNKDSWVVSQIATKIGPDKKYSGVEGWDSKIVANYSCVDSGTPANGDMKSILKEGAQLSVNLNIPAKMNAIPTCDIPESKDGILSATVTFKTSVDNVEEKMGLATLPTGIKFEVKILNIGFGSGYDAEFEDMAGKEGQAPADEDFTFNDKVKIYSVNLGTYMGGFILKDENNKKLFWSSNGTIAFEGKKFHKLGSVLEGYKQYVETSKELQASGYPGPFGAI